MEIDIMENVSEKKYFNFVEGKFSDQLIQEAMQCINEIINEQGNINLDYDDLKLLSKAGEGKLSVVTIAKGEIDKVFKLAPGQLKEFDLQQCQAHLIYLWFSKDIQIDTWVNEMRSLFDYLDPNNQKIIKWGITATDKLFGSSAKVLLLSIGVSQ